MQTSHFTIDLDAGTIETDQLPAGIDLETRAKQWRAALSEARKRRYWAQRDVQTIGA